MIITFCGHAKFHKTEECEQKLLAFLEAKVGERSADIYLGGYGDFDEFAYICCKKYQKTHPNVSLLFITPYMTATYQQNYLRNQKTKYDGIIYPEIETVPPRFAISKRNQWMVEKADCVAVYIDHDWGGAYATYQYAKRKGKSIFHLGKIQE